MSTIAAPQHAEGSFTGAAGRRIAWQSWQDPQAPVRARIVIAHGAGEHGGRYRHLARALPGRGYPVWAIDHHGHGRSEGPRYLESYDDAVADLDRLVDRVVAEEPAAPLFLLGHSMGGAIALLYALRHQAKLAGLIISAPATSDAAAPLPLRYAGRILQLDRLIARFSPEFGLVALPPQDLSRDPAEVQAYIDDPLVPGGGKLKAKTASEMAKAMRGPLAKDLGAITIPILLVHGSDDPLIPLDASEHVRDHVRSDDITMHVYPGLLHEVFNELAEDRERAIEDVVAWLDARAVSPR